MANFPPPPTWADTEDPAWLNWFLTVSNQLEGVGATIAAGFTQALSGSALSFTASAASTNHTENSLTIVLTKTTRVIYWAEIGLYAANALTVDTGELYGSLYRDGTPLRYSAKIEIPSEENVSTSVVLLYAEELPAGTHNLQLGAYVGADSFNSVVQVNPRVIIAYVPT